MNQIISGAVILMLLGSHLAFAQSGLNKPIGSVKGVDVQPAAPPSSDPGPKPSVGLGGVGPQQGQGAFPSNPSHPSQQAPQQAPGVIITIPTN